jgi:hypothetical protein
MSKNAQKNLGFKLAPSLVYHIIGPPSICPESASIP